jgi:hypothetical protein
VAAPLNSAAAAFLKVNLTTAAAGHPGARDGAPHAEDSGPADAVDAGTGTELEQVMDAEGHMDVEDSGRGQQASGQAGPSGGQVEHDNFAPLGDFDSFVKALGFKLPKPATAQGGVGGSGSGGGGSRRAGGSGKPRQRVTTGSSAHQANANRKNQHSDLQVAAAKADAALSAAEMRYNNAKLIAEAVQHLPGPAAWVCLNWKNPLVGSLL